MAHLPYVDYCLSFHQLQSEISWHKCGFWDATLNKHKMLQEWQH